MKFLYTFLAVATLGVVRASNDVPQDYLDIMRDIRDGKSEKYPVLDAATMQEMSQYQRVSFHDSSKGDLAREWGRKLQGDEGSDRNLQLTFGTTGHTSSLLRAQCSADVVYGDTDYDDAYQKICRCRRTSTGQFWMECNLGDEKCEDATVFGNVTEGSEICSGTTEAFFFSESDGDLSTKVSCTFCRNTNDEIQDLCVENIREICTYVDFRHDDEDGNDQPASCRIQEFFENGDDPICEDCEICGGDGSSFGVQHSCFGAAGNECNTNTLAHVHNLAPLLGADQATNFIRGGAFEATCDQASPDRTLYDVVDYNAGLETVCDCDPELGRIFCDMHLDDCFANTCTAISEIFFYNDEGVYESKWTINWITNIWTQADFEQDTGRATGCGVLTADSEGNVFLCDSCDVCQNEDGEVGISFDCFGVTTTSCETFEGRAAFNYPLPTGVEPSYPVVKAGETPSAGETGGDGGISTRGVFAIVGAGLLVAGLLTAILIRPKRSALPAVVDDETVVSAAETEMAPDANNDFEIGEGDDDGEETTEPRIC